MIWFLNPISNQRSQKTDSRYMVLWDDATRREVADLPTYLVTLPTLP